MKKLLLVPALLVAACSDDLRPAEDQVVTTAEGDHDGVPGDAAARPIEASIHIDTITCVETIARFEASADYADDGTATANIACVWTFDDGTTSSDCVGEHLFDRAGVHDFVLAVTDLDTGAVSTVTQTRFFHPPLEVTLDVTGDDLTLSYVATSNTGGEQVVQISPPELVIDGDAQDLERTVSVQQAGTYTVEYMVEDERGVSEICQARVKKEIVLACDGGHEH